MKIYVSICSRKFHHLEVIRAPLLGVLEKEGLFIKMIVQWFQMPGPEEMDQKVEYLWKY